MFYNHTTWIFFMLVELIQSHKNWFPVLSWYLLIFCNFSIGLLSTDGIWDLIMLFFTGAARECFGVIKEMLDLSSSQEVNRVSVGYHILLEDVTLSVSKTRRSRTSGYEKKSRQVCQTRLQLLKRQMISKWTEAMKSQIFFVQENVLHILIYGQCQIMQEKIPYF